MGKGGKAGTTSLKVQQQHHYYHHHHSLTKLFLPFLRHRPLLFYILHLSPSSNYSIFISSSTSPTSPSHLFPFLPFSTSSVSRTTVLILHLGEPQTGARFPSHLSLSLSLSGADGSLLVWPTIHKELAFIQLSREVPVKTVRQPFLIPFVFPLPSL